jgi:hypothetical protein
MRRLVILLSVCAVCLAAPTAWSEEGGNSALPNGISVAAGIFIPNEDFLEDWDEGVDVSVSYHRRFLRLLGVRAGLHFYETEINESDRVGDLSTLGVETLITVQPTWRTVQPWAGAGLGVYFNDLAFLDRGMIIDDTGAAVGALLAGGVRLYPDPSVSFGLQGQVFSNAQVIEEPDGDDEVENLGGFAFRLDFTIHF